MMRVPHAPTDEFSTDASTIEQLSKTDHQFGKLAASYAEINEEIYRIESEEEPTTDEVLETLKKRRLLLKDEIARFLKSCKQ